MKNNLKHHQIFNPGFEQETLLIENYDERKWNLWLDDAGTIKPYSLTCCGCKKLLTLKKVYTSTILHEDKLIKKGWRNGIIECNACHTFYHLGFDYTEPNNSRDVWYISIVSQIKIKEE